ncbi:wax ester/triacylglycerol synthase domain-containing protein [Actinopolymorpha sp. B17G11]|uniref:wax ester/triacylglycerol synthase domain-containing protein n=1 Tax=Actinopolymorpha sp. B17G11 TaxID=3160861 RepID=UPI0032E501CF
MIGVAPAHTGMDGGGFTRRRVMIVSAKIGGGHDAAGRALREAVLQRWPGSEIRWVDTLDRMGPGVGPGFCWIYTSSVERAPWLYDFFYGASWRLRFLARGSKRFTGSWAGRRLAGEIDAFVPGIILSTYPLGSAGLSWLRHHRGLAAPTAAWVSDFAPHPFWVHGGIDTTYVVHEAAVAGARLADASARVAVSALPVEKAFRPGDAASARQHFGLRADAFVVLIACGTFAFGMRDSMLRTLLAADPRVQVVAVCGRNDTVLTRLRSLGYPHDQLLPLGWVDDMPRLNQAADVVVTNAGGVTALEAVASGRPVIMAEPIPAHGIANASLMTVAGLAELCMSQEQLAARVRAALTGWSGPPGVGPAADAGRSHADPPTNDMPATGVRGTAVTGELTAELTDEPSATSFCAAPSRPWPMRPADAFFARVEDGGPPQEIGVVVELDRLSDGRAVTLDQIRATVAARVPHLPPLQWQPMRRGHQWGWAVRRDVDVAALITERYARSDEDVADILDEVFSTRLPRDRPVWRMVLIHPPAGGRSTLVMKVHHSLGDGLSALGLLTWLFDTEPGAGAGATPGDRHADRPTTNAVDALHGLWHLATRGRAPRHPLNRHPSHRAVLTVPLPAAELRKAARRLDVRTFELVLALVAETLDRLLRPAGLLGSGPLRAFVPLSGRPRSDERIFGNWTTAVPVEVAMGPMRPAERLARIRSELRLGVSRGEALAAGLVMRAVGLLPGALHGWFARTTYSDRYLNLVVSYLPGPRGTHRMAGARVHALYPVAPLTRRVPLSIGVITTDETAGVGILADPALGLDRATVAKTLGQAYAELVES